MKKIVACFMVMVLALGMIPLMNSSPAQAEEGAEILAELSYQAAEDVVAGIVETGSGADLEETYGSKTEGYSFTGGVLSAGAKLFASVSGEGIETIKEDDPATPDEDESYSPFRKIEWSKAEYTIGETEENVVPVMTAGKKNPWGKTPYFLIQLSTEGYENIHFSVEMTATKKGPKNLKLQYSADGITFTDIESGNYSIVTNKQMVTAFDLDLTGSQYENQKLFYVRVVAADTAIVSGEGAFYDESTGEGTTGGELAINNIKVTGRKVGTVDVTAQPTDTPDVTVKPTDTPDVTMKPTDTPAATVKPSENPTATPTSEPTKKPQTVKKVFKLNKKSLKLKKGKSYKLKLTYSPKSYGKKLTWKSSKKKVAKVSKKGVVKALKKGKTTITVKNKAGKKATCKVTVK